MRASAPLSAGVVAVESTFAASDAVVDTAADTTDSTAAAVVAAAAAAAANSRCFRQRRRQRTSRKALSTSSSTKSSGPATRKAVLAHHACTLGSPDVIVVLPLSVCGGSGGGKRLAEAGERLSEVDGERLGDGVIVRPRLLLALPLPVVLAERGE